MTSFLSDIINKAQDHLRAWTFVQNRYRKEYGGAVKRSSAAFDKIRDVGEAHLDLRVCSRENLRRLRFEVISKQKVPTASALEIMHQIEQAQVDNCQENLFTSYPKSTWTPEVECLFNRFCELNFQFSHAARPENTDNIQKEKLIYSYDELKNLKIKLGAEGLTAGWDEVLGNTGFVYGVLRTENSDFPELLKDRKDIFTFPVSDILQNEKRGYSPSLSIRLSDWYWYQSSRELDPIYLGSTLRRVLHNKVTDGVWEKIYLYEHADGTVTHFKIRLGEEEFVGQAFAPGLAMILIKELEMADPAFRKRVLKYFDPENPSLRDQQREVLKCLFTTLYSPEATAPHSLNLEHQHYTLQINHPKLYQNEIKQLHAAAQKNDLNSLRQILDQFPFLIDSRDYETKKFAFFLNTPLMVATMYGYALMADYLLSRGANPNLKNHKKLTALMLATLHNRPSIMQLLLTYKGRSPIEQDLLDNKTAVNAIAPFEIGGLEGRWGRYQTALGIAAKMDATDLVALLLQHGAKPRLSHVTVAIPSLTDSEGTRYFLMGKKCYKDQKNQNNLIAYGDWVLPGCLSEETVQDPVQEAVRNLEFLTTINLKPLIENGHVTPQLLHTFEKQSNNHAFRYRVDFVFFDLGQHDSSQPILNSLLARSTGHLLNLEWHAIDDMIFHPHQNLTERYTFGAANQSTKRDYVKASNAILMQIVHQHLEQNSSLNNLKFTHEEIASLNFTNCLETEGVEILHAAIRAGDKDSVIWLLDRHIDIESKSITILRDGFYIYTPLLQAVESQNCEITEELLFRGANANLGTTDGTTPLILALYYFQNFELTRLLLKNGAQLDLHSVTIQKAFLEAVECNHQNLLNLLCGYGISFIQDDEKSLIEIFDFFMRDENLPLLISYVAHHPWNSQQSVELLFDLYNFLLYVIECERADILEVILDYMPLEHLSIFLETSSSPLFFDVSPLHLACRNNHFESVQTLLAKAGICFLRGDDKGLTVLDYAQAYHNSSMITLIKRYSIQHVIQRYQPIILKNAKPDQLECLIPDDALAIYRICRQQHIPCPKPEGMIVYLDLPSLQGLVHGKSITLITERPPSNKTQSQLRKILGCTPLKTIEILYRNPSNLLLIDVDYEIFLDANINLLQLHRHFKTTYCINLRYYPYDQSVMLSRSELEQSVNLYQYLTKDA